jgi:hypothetical protein
MRWFSSFWVTVLVCLVGMGLSWVAGHGWEHVSSWLAPFEFVSNPIVIGPAVLGAYALVRLILQRVIAYTESAIDASPRESRTAWGSRRASLGLLAYRLFGNPTGKWLAPYALVLGVVAGAALLIRVPMMLAGLATGEWQRHEVLLLTLIGLYATTVTMAMLFPDRPQRLRPVEEADPDEVLELPDSDGPPEAELPPAAKTKPPGKRKRSLFGRKPKPNPAKAGAAAP